MTNTIIDQLKKATDGLLMMSESEYPFEVILWEEKEPLTTPKILQLKNHPQDSPIEEVELEYFFRNCAFEKEWHNEIQKEEVKKFQILLQSLKNNLNEIKVYRVGTISIDVYIIGKTSDKNSAGISTKVVET
ncbi:nuclease A inhibitor family protein [Anabaena cylindrica FACHB-243]|uniref:Nuclease A inhibitor family protein n=1 Tax=Anabaena cylindrica (strain ATCC 27899 / PCC 7122) TaxID=272123 RepID=K9ZCA8_ANACC|nr:MULTISPECIES: nuclease A inhibitor family protein [Anabaena]AFZ56858.1 Nuclease A inhibitor family protein [Anabaena cylindrica PCC 7122]MBD2416664.1 nuclease A inhibitor family protein [Anabaena cylindrica FACHB-243]MBY5285659.1 nuclease [Anabaena sp. CCAP 1446/1C]MBY5311681.1 nuclease [Anabaena sp. CCAP 1446/1C]MCM2409037.1 nuclease A inhibitor family protein [Anabaena sp. CCAP 1446/1C]